LGSQYSVEVHQRRVGGVVDHVAVGVIAGVAKGGQGTGAVAVGVAFAVLGRALGDDHLSRACLAGQPHHGPDHGRVGDHAAAR
jgi:hypothetical protein